MNEWYLIYGFSCESELNDYREGIKVRKGGTSPVEMNDFGGVNLGVHLLDLDRIGDFYFSDSPDEVRDYAYYVFWKLGAGFSAGYGFYDKKDM